ncbi:hypothetical protein N2152v2_000465 [Parachlorella kessleri]
MTVPLPPSSSSEGSKLSKKEKKLKAAALAAEAAGATKGATVVGTEPAAGAGKKEKKKKRSKGETAVAVDGDTSAFSEKKLKKKKKKREQTDSEATTTAAEGAVADVPAQVQQQVTDDGAELARPKKKAKKAAQQMQHSTVSAQGMAEVGDRQLAASRPPLRKVLYAEHAEVAGMSNDDVAAWRKERRIKLQDADVRPITRFDLSGLSQQELHATRAFTQPSPIQAQCLPLALSGRDLVGIAATGSGKTLAFGLPALAHIRAQRDAGVASGKKPVALVIAPTRELALQINAVLEEAGEKCGITSVCVYGGVPKKEQMQALRKGAAIVVATPGRLEDLLSDGACKLDEVSYLVLDEADRMLDLGFEPHIRAIASKTRADRQTLMFSATWPSAIRKLAAEFLCNPARVTIGSQDLAANHNVKQVVEVIEAPARDARLHELLGRYHKSRTNRVLVFVLYKKEADRVEQFLQRKGWKAAAIHGDITQAQRTKAVEQFKAGSMPLLVATDVAARGLDIPDVEAVINYSFPLTTEDYVHRIGRTGRAGKTGVAHTLFVGANDKPRAGELINVLREAKQDVPEDLLKFGTAVKKKESKMYGAHFKDVDHTQKAKKTTFDSDDDE